MNPDDVLSFWFGEQLEIRAQWFRKDAEFDAQINTKFLAMVEAAAQGELNHWLEIPRHSLAYIILLDQFPRNIFRNSPRSFAYDDLALQAAKDMIHAGIHTQFHVLEQLFIYLPLEHSENLADQEQTLSLMSQWQNESPLQGFYDYAIKHHAVIQRFGRFPHRNALLGRSSTAEELNYLALPGSGF
jgi:uncharacterized protein (DUF924 family)